MVGEWIKVVKELIASDGSRYGLPVLTRSFFTGTQILQLAGSQAPRRPPLLCLCQVWEPLLGYLKYNSCFIYCDTALASISWLLSEKHASEGRSLAHTARLVWPLTCVQAKMIRHPFPSTEFYNVALHDPRNSPHFLPWPRNSPPWGELRGFCSSVSVDLLADNLSFNHRPRT